jgi:hypothetical protein
MLSRYERNQIYNSNGKLDPADFAAKYPHLRVILITAPQFTSSKKDAVKGSSIQYWYGNGDKENCPSYWECMDEAVHIGQGTSSDLYGQSGRNIDLVLKTYKDYENKPTIKVTQNGVTTTAKKVALTATSVPVNYFNIKVNVASSENANNALLQKRYNRYNPFKKPFIRSADENISFIKDTMEFYNCVVFIRETSIINNREFNDGEVHFYAIGNIGDSKKTDKTRLVNPDDIYECCLEIRDVRLPLSDFPVEQYVGAEYEEKDLAGKKTYPLLVDANRPYLRIKDESGNLNPLEDNHVFDVNKYDYYIDGKLAEKFNEKQTYGWRYIYEAEVDSDKIAEELLQ